MKILSLSFGHDGLACVVVDGKLKAAIASERLTRFKKQRGVNRQTIQYVLDAAGLQRQQIDLVAVTNWFWDVAPNGRELYDKQANGVAVTHLNGQPLTHEQFSAWYAGAQMIMGPLVFHLDGQRFRCVMVDHHLAHCAYSFYMSPFERALCVSFDVADNEGSNHSICFLDDRAKRTSLLRRGLFQSANVYSLICDFLGFYPSVTDAGKIMALAAFGKPLEDVRELARLWPGDPGDVFNGDLYAHLLTRCGVGHVPRQRVLYPQLKGEGGVPDPAWLDKKDWRSPLSTTIAATIQAVLEESALGLLKQLADATRSVSRDLCLSGGTALNCVMNGKILHAGLFENVYIAPAIADDGLAIGAAMEVEQRLELMGGGGGDVLRSRQALSPKPAHNFREAFEGGRRYSAPEIERAIEAASTRFREAGVTARKLSEEELVERVADAIIADRIVGWFYRGSELGPRALGHRSILANPRNRNMKDILNGRVKHREEFRPFAPAVLVEQAGEWFDLPAGGVSPFMLFSVQCRRAEEIPSAVHIDGSARLQTVDRENNGRFYDLIERLYRKTGVPVVINTSFNVMGEPIVESPGDAIDCFLGTGIDVLAMEDWVVEKG